MASPERAVPPARVPGLLEQLAAAGVIAVPDKCALAPYRPARKRAEPVPVREIVAALGGVQPVSVEPVPPEEQAIWDATVAAYHALGFQRAFGAHQRYWIYLTVDGQRVIAGALLFAAAARNVAVRDRYLGWTAQQQQRQRHLIVANSRFLILPGVRVPHLASHALSLGLRRLRDDWQGRFGYAPVAVETFVTPPWRGTCYRAANWVHLGQTTGRGRQDRDYSQGGTVREVFVRPLVRNWRRVLLGEEVAAGLPAPRRGGGEQQRSASDRGGDGMITADQALNERAEGRIQQRFAAMAPFLDEKQRRLLAGAEAITYGAGGQEQVATLLGISKITVGRGMRELQHPETVQRRHVRKPGGGRKRATDLDRELRADGQLRGSYRKRHLGEDEEGFVRGDQPALFSLGDVPFGVAICAEGGVDYPFDEAAASGARLVCFCAAPGLYHRRVDEAGWRRGLDWWEGAGLADAQRHAHRLGIWIALATQAGSTVDEDFPRLAALVDPNGPVVARLPDWREGELMVDIPVGA